MKKLHHLISTLCILALLLGTGCSNDEIFVENVAGISLEEVTDNLITLIEDDTYQLKVKVNPENAANIAEYDKFNYASSSQQVFTVNTEGVVTAIDPGEAILTVTAQHNAAIKLMCMIRVEERIFPVTSIEAGGLETGKFIEGMVLDLSQYITVLPENATNPEVVIESSDPEIAVLDEKNKTLLHLLAEGKVTITVKSVDGSDVTKAIELTVLSKDTPIAFISLDRTGWVITPSHTPLSDGGIGGDQPEYLTDGNPKTGLSLYKPGKQGTPKEDEVGFTIELPAAVSVNAFRLTHRQFGYNYLAPFAIDVWGSNDGENFTVIQKGVPTPYEAGSKEVEVTRIFPQGATPAYKFVKVVYANFNTTNGNTVQVMEFELGTGEVK